ncbi:MAG: class I SAM-dependent methyltransferase [Nanoarchaeota archaeon]
MAGKLKFEWNALNYLTHVEWASKPWFKRYQDTETGYLQTLRDLPLRNVIDAGAGSGRIFREVAPRVKSLVAVDLADNMLDALRAHAKAYSNIIVVKGDYTRLDDVLRKESLLSKTDNPLVVCLQNSLGTTKGSMWKAVSEFRKVAEPRDGDIVVSVFNSEALEEYGLPLYKELEGMVGPVDSERTDTNAGVFASKTGYFSQWFTPQLRAELKEKLDGTVLTEIRAPQFTVIHVTYSARGAE